MGNNQNQLRLVPVAISGSVHASNRNGTIAGRNRAPAISETIDELKKVRPAAHTSAHAISPTENTTGSRNGFVPGVERADAIFGSASARRGTTVCHVSSVIRLDAAK